MTPGAPDAVLAEWLELLAAGKAYEAHERVEEVWRACPEGRERLFLKGLIHLAVARVHAERRNRHGAVAKLASGREYLRQSGRERLDDPELLRAVLETVRIVEETGRGTG